MADNTGPDPKPETATPLDPKPTDGRSGAVKPPVLDLKPREGTTDAGKSDGKPADKPKAAEPLRPPTPATAESRGFPFAAAVTGGILGLAAAYGLAWAGLWPTAPVAPPTPDPRLAQFAAAIPELETVTQTTQGELATLNQRLAALEETGTPAAPGATVDVAGIEADIAALGERIEALSAAPAPAAEPVDIDGLNSQIASLSDQLSELGARLGTAEASLRDLDAAVGQTSAALAEQPSDIGAVLQLPLILSGLETAFATGRPFEIELGALRSAAPQATVPPALADAAATGLVRPDLVAARFNEAIPAMLAGRPIAADGQWQDGAVDWLAGVVALRPTTELEGDAPDAIMSRLEGAVARRDWVAAETLFEQLPEPMRAAAGDLHAEITAQARASTFLQTLRTQALSGEVAP